MPYDRHGPRHRQRHLRRHRPAPAFASLGPQWPEAELGALRNSRGCPISRAFCARDGILTSIRCGTSTCDGPHRPDSDQLLSDRLVENLSNRGDTMARCSRRKKASISWRASLCEVEGDGEDEADVARRTIPERHISAKLDKLGRGQGGENITGEKERRTARLFLLGLASVGDGLGFALPGEH